MASLSREATLSQWWPASAVSRSKTRGARGLGVGEAGEREHPLQEGQVLRRGPRRSVLPVVGLVGQAEAALLEEDEVALGVARVVVDEELEEPADALPLEPAEGASSVSTESTACTAPSSGVSGVRRVPRARLVHEARVEVAELALLGAGLGILRLLDDVAHGLLGLFGQHVERAVPRLVGGDLGARDPLAVDVPEQVVLQADVRVEFSVRIPDFRAVSALMRQAYARERAATQAGITER